MFFDDFLSKFMLFNIPLIFIVPWVVERLKNQGWVSSKWAGLTAIVVSAFAVLAVALIDFHPTIAPIIQYIMAFVYLGLMAAGAYSQKKVFDPKEE